MKDMYGRIMIDVEGTSLSQQDRELISNGNVGGIILFSKNFNSFEQISDLVNEIHAIKENILLAVDQEGGRVQRFSKDFTKLPSLQDLAKYSEINNDPDICKEVAWLTSSELIAAGIDSIIYHKDYKNDELVTEILEQSKVNIKKYNN